MTDRTCTVIVSAPMIACGAPAVAAFGEFAECAEHHIVVAPRADEFVVGGRAEVVHVGVRKVGVVEKVTAAKVGVRVFVASTGREKVVTVARAAARAV